MAKDLFGSVNRKFQGAGGPLAGSKSCRKCNPPVISEFHRGKHEICTYLFLLESTFLVLSVLFLWFTVSRRPRRTSPRLFPPVDWFSHVDDIFTSANRYLTLRSSGFIETISQLLAVECCRFPLVARYNDKWNIHARILLPALRLGLISRAEHNNSPCRTQP